MSIGESLLKLKLANNIISENGYNTKRYSLEKIKQSNLGNKEVQKVTYTNIQNFLTAITDLSNSFIKKIVIELKAIFKEAQRRESIYKNPTLNIEKSKSKKLTKKWRLFQ